MSDGIQFDAHNLQELGRDLRAAARAVRRETDVTLLKIGTEIMVEAKAIASQHSKTIAGTIKLKMIPGAVVISGGAQDVPIAALYELGNKGAKRASPTFRHPVFGGSTWVEQPRYRFLAPALAVDRRQITKRMNETWDRALEPHRLRPEG